MSSLTRELLDGHASLELAENLEFHLSADAVRRYVVKRTSKGRLRSAWHHVEYGVCRTGDASEFERLESLDCARSLTKMVLEKPEAPVNTHLEALVLASYIPVFKKRAFDMPITESDCEHIYQSLGNAFAYVKPLEYGCIPSGLALQTLVLALAARTRRSEYLLFPTSPREEASEAQVVNHDSYFIRDGAKLPIQQKLIPTASSYTEPVTMLTLLPLIDKASRKAGYVVDDDIADQLNNPISLLVTETSRGELAKHEKRFVDELSESVVAHYHQAALYLDQNKAA